jgi:hypothetical protein
MNFRGGNLETGTQIPTQGSRKLDSVMSLDIPFLRFFSPVPVRIF